MIDAATAIATRTDLLAQVAEARQAHAQGEIDYSEITALLDAIRTQAHPNHLTVAPSQVQVGWVLDVRHPETTTVLSVERFEAGLGGTVWHKIVTEGMEVTMADAHGHLLTLTVREEAMPF